MNLWETFAELTSRHFDFLEKEFQFKLKEVKAPFVIYESDKIQVSIYYDVARHHELDLAIRKIGDDPRTVPSVHLQGLIMLADWRLAEKCQQVYASTKESLEIEVQQLAGLLKLYGSSVLKGEERDFERLDRLEKEYVQKMNEHTQLNHPKGRFRR